MSWGSWVQVSYRAFLRSTVSDRVSLISLTNIDTLFPNSYTKQTNYCFKETAIYFHPATHLFKSLVFEDKRKLHLFSVLRTLSAFTLYTRLAQSVERQPFKLVVEGSSPSSGEEFSGFSLHLCTFKTPPSGAFMTERGDADCTFSMCNGVKTLISDMV